MVFSDAIALFFDIYLYFCKSPNVSYYSFSAALW